MSIIFCSKLFFNDHEISNYIVSPSVTETVVPSQWDAYVKHKELNIQSLLAVQDVR